MNCLDEEKFSSPSSKKHVLFISFPGFGHITPLLRLAEKIASIHHVTFAISRNKISEINQKLRLFQSLKSRILPLEDGFPESASFKAYLAANIIPAVRDLIKSLRTNSQPEAEHRFIDNPVNVLILDVMLAAAVPECHSSNIPFYFFCTSSIESCVKMLDINQDTPTGDPNKIDPFFQKTATGYIVGDIFKKLSIALSSTVESSRGLIFNSCTALEPNQCAILRHFTEQPTFCVGPLIEKNENANYDLTEERLFSWLMNKKPRSVLYVAFGTVMAPASAQIREIGEAVLSLNRPFIWSLKEQYFSALPGEFKNIVEGSGDHGLVLPWAPQAKVLSHPSIGIFLSHCGWNSTLEAAYYGLPVVAWPIYGDQLENAQILVRLGTATIASSIGFISRSIIPANKIAELLNEVVNLDAGETQAANFTKNASRLRERLVQMCSMESNTNFQQLLYDL